MFLLFYPFRFGHDASPWKDFLPYGIHAGMWAGLVWSFWPVARGRRGGQWGVLVLLVLAGGVSEVVQQFVGRTPEWRDWGMDTLGAVLAFLCGCVFRKKGIGRAAAFGAVLLACVGFRAVEEWRAFPVLADGTSRWGRYRWEANGVKLRSGKTCLRAFRDRNGTTEYPGMFRLPLCCDWRGSRGMELEIYWPVRNGGDGILGVRVDDLPGNPPYDDRWQTEARVTNGWNTLVMDKEWLVTPGGRQMDAAHIRTWGVFVISGVKTNYFAIRKARLLFTPL